MLNKISDFWNKLQENLFPELRATLGDLTPEHEKVVAVLSAARIEEFVQNNQSHTGRPRKSRKILARAFVAKVTLNIAHTKALRERLLYDYRLRAIVGWDYEWQVPSESVFCRVFTEFACNKLPDLVHKVLVESVLEGQVVEHISRDASDIPSREKSRKNKISQEGKTAGPRPKVGICELQARSGKGYSELLSDIPRECDSGSKVSSKGTRLYWLGYKLHADVIDGDIPINCELTSASVSDMKMAIPMSLKSESRVVGLYELMDKGYYAKAIMAVISERGRVPLIQKKPSNRKQKLELRAEGLAQKSLNWQPADVVRMKHRTSTERVFSQLKDCYAGRNFRYRGYLKVNCHLMFGILALTIIQLLRLIT